MKIAIYKRVGVSGLPALLWLVLAVLRPTTTFHLAPLLVAVWPALSAPNGVSALRMSMAGLLVAVATTGALSLMGSLEGPSLLPWGDAAVESLVAAAIGANVGLFRPIASRETQQT